MNDNNIFSKVAEKSDWRMHFDAHDAPPKPASAVPFDEARYYELAVELDVLLAMEPESARSPEGYPIHAEFSTEHRRPFQVGGTTYL